MYLGPASSPFKAQPVVQFDLNCFLRDQLITPFVILDPLSPLIKKEAWRSGSNRNVKMSYNYQ